MDRNGLLALYNYNAYANNVLLKAAAQLPQAEFIRKISPSHNSVHELLIHMFEGEAFFLSVCKNHSLEESLNLPTLTSIHHAWTGLAEESNDFIASLAEADLAKEITIFIKDQPIYLSKWQALIQAFVHSTHHRGELSIILTQLGYPLPSLDILAHFIEQSGQQWPLK